MAFSALGIYGSRVEPWAFIYCLKANKIIVLKKLEKTENETRVSNFDLYARLRPLAALLLLVPGLMLGLPGAPAAAEEPVWRYTIRPGDNIWSLSRRYLVDWRHWQAIQELNGVTEPDRLTPGERLSFPMRWLRLEPASALLEEITGEVWLVRDGERQAGLPGTTLLIGDTVVTDDKAAAVIRFADRSKVTLGGDAELVLDRLSEYRGTGMVDTRLRLERGRLETKVEPARGPGSRFDIVTPPAVSSVRGTDLRVGLDGAARRGGTEVLTGAVSVSGDSTTRRVGAGFGTVTAVGEPPASPRPLLDPPELADLPARLERRPLRVAAPPLAGAERFRLMIGVDEAFSPPLKDELMPAGDFARLDDLPDGTYAARLRGIEADGLEGKDQSWQLVIHTRPEPPAPLSPPENGRLRDPLPQFGWAEPQGAASYQLEIATTPDFADPVLRHEGLTGESLALASPLPLGAYFWRIATTDTEGRQGPWGDVQSFEILEPPADPSIQEVESGRGRLAIRLGSLEPGQQLHFQLAADPDFTAILHEGTTDEATLQVSGFQPGEYWFRAQIIEADGYTTEFTTPQRIDVPPVSWWPALLAPFALLILLL